MTKQVGLKEVGSLSEQILERLHPAIWSNEQINITHSPGRGITVYVLHVRQTLK